MLVKELKEKLKSYGLSTAGVKQELEARLENYENELNAKDPSRLAAAVSNTTSGGGESGGDEQDENETTELNNSTDESKHLENGNKNLLHIFLNSRYLNALDRKSFIQLPNIY